MRGSSCFLRERSRPFSFADECTIVTCCLRKGFDWNGHGGPYGLREDYDYLDNTYIPLALARIADLLELYDDWGEV
jgi:hypothetical protein